MEADSGGGPLARPPPQGPSALTGELFRFTYAHSFLVMADGPIGELPSTDSSVSFAPLKLMEYPRKPSSPSPFLLLPTIAWPPVLMLRAESYIPVCMSRSNKNTYVWGDFRALILAKGYINGYGKNSLRACSYPRGSPSQSIRTLVQGRLRPSKTCVVVHPKEACLYVRFRLAPKFFRRTPASSSRQSGRLETQIAFKIDVSQSRVGMALAAPPGLALSHQEPAGNRPRGRRSLMQTPRNRRKGTGTA
jgi:hypothetical protein